MTALLSIASKICPLLFVKYNTKFKILSWLAQLDISTIMMMLDLGRGDFEGVAMGSSLGNNLDKYIETEIHVRKWGKQRVGYSTFTSLTRPDPYLSLPKPSLIFYSFLLSASSPTSRWRLMEFGSQ
jgi:hypothetical protein